MIGAVTDGARDYLDFIGFRKDLSELIGALERRYGKGQTTDRIQQEFYQLSQERGETVQEFAGRIETKYKRLIELYPGRYDSEMLKERLFYGMTQHLRDSMRYLYKKPETNYEELLLTAKEAECEWTEHKTLKTKQTTVGEDTKHEELRSRLDKLAETVKAASLQKKGNKQKKVASTTVKPPSSPRSPKEDQNLLQLDPFMATENRSSVTKCGGWGHVARECPTPENLEWRELNQASSAPKETGPESPFLKNSIKANATLLEADRYLNPDPLVRLIGETNETQVKLEGQNFTALIDSGAVISQITESLANMLGLKI